MVLKAVSVLLFVVPVVLCADRGSQCITPNNEKARCLPISQCKVIADTITAANSAAIDFAKRSQCGYDTEPLVCCGKNDYRFVAQPSKGPKPNLGSLLPDRSRCGRQADDNRVYGGNLTNIGEFPWMALLRYKYSDGSDAGFKCGGTLISNRYVLTAAHCVAINSYAGFNVDSVRLGEWQISSDEDCETGLVVKECADPVVDVGIERVIPHQQYSRRQGRNDMALLRLKRSVEYTDYIRALCLPYPDEPLPTYGTELYIAGWGATENSSTSDFKLKVKIPLVSRSDCESKVRQRGRITEDHICAGGVPGKDSCQGDSGGPLMHLTKAEDGANQWIQEGVVSYGVGCGVTGFPGVYTKVSKYLNWIVNNMSA